MEKLTKRKSKYLHILTTFLVMLLFGQIGYGQDAVINEMSQGSDGTKEWIEILVVTDNLDMRGFQIGDLDDGSWHAGPVFTSDASWSSVAAGTVIAVYNGADVDGTIGSEDTDFSDASVKIASNNSTYFSGNWGSYGNSDSDDCAALRDASDVLIHDMAVTHATATVTAPGGGQVKYYTGGNTTDISDNSFWTSAASTSGTPGLANGGDNSTWVTALQNPGTPTITTSLTENNFGVVEVGTESTPANYVVEGANLEADIAITAPTDFEISFDNIDYSVNPLALAMGGGQVSSTVYVRFAPGTEGEKTGSITHTSTNAEQKDVTVSGTGLTVLAEPTNHVTDFAAAENGYDQIDLSWVDAIAGAQAPDNYLIMANTTGVFIAPVDGTDPAEDTDLSDGEAVIKVANDGTQAASFTGLDISSAYYFQIWSYTNAGTYIDFKDDGPTANATTTSIPLPYSEDFASGLGAFTTINVSGATKEWYHDTDKVTCNGYNSGDLEEDWLIFPVMDFDANYNETLTFQTWRRFGADDADNYLKLMYSTNYSGKGDPNAEGVVWNDLTFTPPSAEQVWTASGDIDLTSIVGASVYLAFKYNYNSGSYRWWSIDDILIDGTNDITKPTINSTLAYVDATHLKVTFSEEVDQATAETLTNYVFTGSLDVGTNPTEATLANGNEVTLTVADMTSAPDNATITVTVSNVTDLVGNIIDDSSDEATYTFPDETAPVVTITPNDGTTGVQINANITIGFNEAVRKIDDSPVVDVDLAAMITLKLTNDAGDDVAFSATINEDKDLITIDPTNDFASLQDYYVAITASLEDAADNAIAATNATFTSADADAPVVTFAPENLATGIATTSNVTISFNEAIRNLDNSAVETADLAAMLTFKLTDAAGEDVAFAATINAEKTEITIDPTEALAEVQDYYVAIAASLEDADDNAISAANITFTTADETAPVATFFPENTATDIAVDTDITITFDEAIRNADASEITNDNVGNILTFAGAGKPTGIPFTATIDGNVITVTPDVDLDTARTYQIELMANTVEDASGNTITTSQVASFTTVTPVVALTAPVGGEEFNSGETITITWTSNHVNNINIDLFVSYLATPGYISLFENVDATLGTKDYDIPDDAITSDGYKIRITDVNYAEVSDESTAITVTDAIFPTVSATNPADEALVTDLAQNLVIEFSEYVQAGTGNIVLYKADATVVETIAADAEAVTITENSVDIDLTADLESETAYYVLVDAGAFVDYSTNEFAGITDATVWNFETPAENMPELFFSEYIEGSSYNKALEIYNPSDYTISLNDYMLKGTSNAATDWENEFPFPENATIAAKDVYVIVNKDASQEMKDIADWVDSGSETGYNGNDARGLFKIEGEETTLIDVVGNPVNPDEELYAVAGTDGGLLDHTIVRKATVLEGNTDWVASAGTDADNSEWVLFDKDYLDSLGTHFSAPPVFVETITLAGEGDATTIDTDKGTLQINATIAPANADDQTLTWSVNDETLASIDQEGLLSALNNGTVTVTATANDDSGVTGTIDIVITNQTSVTVVTSITVTGTDDATSIDVNGGTLQMIATVLPEDATDNTVTWSIDGETIATISETGLLTANGEGLNGDVVVTATANDGSLKEGSATITVTNQVIQVTDLATLRAETAGTDVIYEITGEVVMSYMQSNRNQKYVQDNTAGILIDDEDGTVTTSLAIYDGITGLRGTLVDYYGTLELKPSEDPGDASSTGNTIVPQVITLEEFNTNFEDYESELIKLREVTFTIADGDTVFAKGKEYEITNNEDVASFRTTFYDADYIASDSIIPEGAITIVGIANSRNYDGMTYHITARDRNDFILEEILVTSIEISSAGDATEITEEGGTLQLSVTVLPEDATDNTVSWSVDDETIATIDQEGLLTATGNGVVEVTATANDGSGIDDSIEITISNQSVILVETITVTGEDGATTIETDKGTLQMTATITPEDANVKDVVWSIENGTGAATITEAGLVTAVNNGTVTVKAAATDESGVEGTLELTLSNQVDIVLVDSIIVTGAEDATTIEVDGGTLQLTATVYPETASNDTIIWSVENGTGEATISETGLLTAVADGTVTAKASAQDGSQVVGTLEVTISNQANIVLVETIVVTSEGGATTIDVKADSLQMFANVLPENATDNTVTWSVDDATIATISETGLLTAMANGTVIVKASANDESGIEGTLEITITNQEINVLEVTLSNSIEVYPNPTEGKFVVEITNPVEDVTIQVVNLYGQVVYNTEIQSGNSNIAIDLTNNDSGIYIIKLSNNKEYAIKRIVLE